jgi:tetratricopeptide (TPR) repeat protein
MVRASINHESLRSLCQLNSEFFIFVLLNLNETRVFRMSFLERFAAIVFFSGCLFQSPSQAAQPKTCLELDPFRQSSESYVVCDAELQRAGKDDAFMAKLHAHMGEALYWSGRFDLAIESFNAALGLDKTLVETRIQRGWAFIRTNEMQRAFQDFSDSLEEKPDSGRAMFAIGFMYDMAGDKEKALAAYKQSVETTPNYLLARAALAQTYYYDRGEKDLGIAEFDKLISLGETELNKVQFFGDPNLFPTKDYYASVLLDRAIALRDIGRYDDAYSDINWLIKRYPDAYAPLEFKASLLAFQQKYDEAAKLAAAASANCYKNSPYLPCQNSDSTLVLSLMSLNKNKEAADIGRRLIATGRTGPRVDNASFFAGVAMKRLGHIDEARQYISGPVERGPHYRASLVTQLIQNGFYEGHVEDELNERILNGLEACLIDDTCLDGV